MSPDINRVFVGVSVFPWVVATPEGGLKYTQVICRDHMEELPWGFRGGTRCEGYASGVGIHGLEFNELEKYVFRRGRGFLGKVHYEGEGVCDFC